MDKKNLSDLYENDDNFKGYVDRYCEQRGIEKEEAFKHAIVNDYADDILNPSKDMDWYLNNKDVYNVKEEK